jgi:hypothetical protein
MGRPSCSDESFSWPAVLFSSRILIETDSSLVLNRPLLSLAIPQHPLSSRASFKIVTPLTSSIPAFIVFSQRLFSSSIRSHRLSRPKAKRNLWN